MKIHESAENYLETILVLSKRKQFVRSIDIVNELNFSKPSVSVAMKHLREDGYIVMDADGYITLSNMGYEIANRIYERHQLISTILIEIGVDSETAIISASSACVNQPGYLFAISERKGSVARPPPTASRPVLKNSKQRVRMVLRITVISFRPPSS